MSTNGDEPISAHNSGKVLARGGAIIINDHIITSDEGGILTEVNGELYINRADTSEPGKCTVAPCSLANREAYSIDTFEVINVADFGYVILFYAGIIHLPNVQLEKPEGSGTVIIKNCAHDGGNMKAYLFMANAGQYVLVNEFGKVIRSDFYRPTFELESGDIFGNFKAKNATKIIAVKDGYIFQEEGDAGRSLKFHELIILPPTWLFVFYIVGVAILSFFFGFRMS